MERIVVMDRVGGYGDLLLLEADARAYDLVVIALRGEAEAAKIRELEARATHGRR